MKCQNCKLSSTKNSSVEEFKYCEKKLSFKCIPRATGCNLTMRKQPNYEYLLCFVGKHAPMVTRLHVCFSSKWVTLVRSCVLSITSHQRYEPLYEEHLLSREFFRLLLARDYNFMTCGESRVKKAIFWLKNEIIISRLWNRKERNKIPVREVFPR